MNAKETILLAYKEISNHTGKQYYRDNASALCKSALKAYFLGNHVEAKDLALKALAEFVVDDYTQLTYN